jgi:hypothetical protein
MNFYYPTIVRAVAGESSAAARCAIYDRALVVRHDAVSRSVQFNDKLIAFAKHWGFRPRACAPYRARTKGKTESGVGGLRVRPPECPDCPGSSRNTQTHQQLP